MVSLSFETWKSLEIRQFTIASRLSGLIDILTLFEKNGVDIKETVNTNSRCHDFITGELEKATALLLEVR